MSSEPRRLRRQLPLSALLSAVSLFLGLGVIPGPAVSPAYAQEWTRGDLPYDVLQRLWSRKLPPLQVSPLDTLSLPAGLGLDSTRVVVEAGEHEHVGCLAWLRVGIAGPARYEVRTAADSLLAITGEVTYPGRCLAQVNIYEQGIRAAKPVLFLTASWAGGRGTVPFYVGTGETEPESTATDGFLSALSAWAVPGGSTAARFGLAPGFRHRVVRAGEPPDSGFSWGPGEESAFFDQIRTRRANATELRFEGAPAGSGVAGIAGATTFRYDHVDLVWREGGAVLRDRLMGPVAFHVVIRRTPEGTGYQLVEVEQRIGR